MKQTSPQNQREIDFLKAKKKIEKQFADYKKKHNIVGDIFKAEEEKKVIIVDKLPNMFTKEQHNDYRKAQLR